MSAIFYQIFIFYEMIAVQKLWKMFFISSENIFSFSRYSSFDICLPFFFVPVIHCFRGWFKKNLKVYDVINCLNKNLIKHFVWNLKKQIRCDIETLSIDRGLKATFLRKNHAENVHQKLAPDPFSILLNNPKQSLDARKFF